MCKSHLLSANSLLNHSCEYEVPQAAVNLHCSPTVFNMSLGFYCYWPLPSGLRGVMERHPNL